MIEDATKAWRASPPDLMLLDVMLPDGDGRDFCRLICTASDVLMLVQDINRQEDA